MRLSHTSLGDGLHLCYDSQDHIIGGQIAATGLYEPFEETLLLSALNQGDSVIDIGANIGVYTLQMAQKVGKYGKVYAIEPEPHNIKILERNIAENKFSQVEVLPFALSNKQSRTKLYLSYDNFGDHRIYDGDYVRKRKTISVVAKTLDSLLYKKTGNISVMKIDTQGYEPFVIEGAQKILQREKPILFMEYWPFGYRKSGADKEKMLHFLSSLYSEVYYIDGEKKLLNPFSQNVLSEEEDAWANLLFT